MSATGDSLFQSAADVRVRDDPIESADDNDSSVEQIPSRPSQPKSGPVGGRGVFRREEKPGVLKGRAPVGHDPRKFRYDVTRGKGANLGFSTSRDDRMSAIEAGEMLDRIHVALGLARASEGILRAIDEAIFFSHTINGASVLGPGRAKLSVPGMTEEFSFSVVRDILGVDHRRFFRAFADDTKDVNKKVLAEYDAYDHVKAERWGWLQQVAYERGLHRYPYLAHDSADACIDLAPAERAALAASLVLVVGSTNNSADRLKANNRVASADGFDSTTGTRV